jgi:hypothetical protein
MKLLLPLKLIEASAFPQTPVQEVPSTSSSRVLIIVVFTVVTALGHPAPVVTEVGMPVGVMNHLVGHRLPTFTE